MKTKILHSYGNNEINEYEFDLGEMLPNQMLIKTTYTGICRSDIDQYLGHIEIPYGHFGHESIGEVIDVGAEVNDFKIGDYVASRNDPAFSEYFYADEHNTIKVSENNTKYIIEPIACSVNIAERMLSFIQEDSNILFVGSGFIANIAAQYIRHLHKNINIYVIGSHNKKQWQDIDTKFIDWNTASNMKFKNIVELSGKRSNLEQILTIAATGANICVGAALDEPLTTTFWNMLWNNYTLLFPSPRDNNFHKYMKKSEACIYLNYINVEWAWTHEYKASDFKRAFEESVLRKTTKPFVRSYIKW